MRKLYLTLAFACFFATFTTYAEDSLKVIHPNGGEKFNFEQDINIQWDGVPTNQPVDIFFSKDAGTSWNKIKEDATGLNYNWTELPDEASDKCLVKVEGEIEETTGFEIEKELHQILPYKYVGYRYYPVVSNSGKYIFFFGWGNQILYNKDKNKYTALEDISPSVACIDYNDNFLFIAERGVVKRFNISENQFDKTYSNPNNVNEQINAIDISPNSKYLAYGDEKGLITIFDLNTREIYKEYKVPHAPEQEVRVLRFLPDSKRLQYVESYWVFEHIIDIHTGEEVHQFGGIGYIDISKDGNYYLKYHNHDNSYNYGKDMDVIVFDKTFNPVDTIQSGEYFNDNEGRPYINVKFTSDSKNIVLVFSRQIDDRIFCDIKLWSIKNKILTDLGEIDLGHMTRELYGGMVTVEIDDNDNIYISDYIHMTVYKLNNLENIYSLATIGASDIPHAMNIVQRNNEETLLIAGSYGSENFYNYYDLESGKSNSFIDEKTKNIYEYKEIKGQNKILALSKYSNSAFISEIDLEDFEVTKTYSDFSLYGDISPWGIAVSDDGNLIAVSYDNGDNDADYFIRIYDKKQDIITHSLFETNGYKPFRNNHSRIAFSPDGNLLLYNAEAIRTDNMPSIRIYDLKTNELIFSDEHLGNTVQIYSLFAQFISNGKKAIYTKRGNQLFIYDIETKANNNLPIGAPCYISKDERYIVGISYTDTSPRKYFLEIYDLSSKKQLLKQEVDEYPKYGLVMNEACTKIVTRSDDGMHFYDIKLNEASTTTISDISDATFSIFERTAPDTPDNLAVEVDENYHLLTWEASEDADYYRVYKRKEGEDYQNPLVYNTSSLEHYDGDIFDEGTYYYVVTAVNDIGESQHSNEVSVTVTSVNDSPKEAESFVYPNPSQDEIQIFNYEGEITIINSIGIEVWNGYLQENTAIDVSGFERGYYLVRMKDKVSKFIKS